MQYKVIVANGSKIKDCLSLETIKLEIIYKIDKLIITSFRNKPRFIFSLFTDNNIESDILTLRGINTKRFVSNESFEKEVIKYIQNDSAMLTCYDTQINQSKNQCVILKDNIQSSLLLELGFEFNSKRNKEMKIMIIPFFQSDSSYDLPAPEKNITPKILPIGEINIYNDYEIKFESLTNYSIENNEPQQMFENHQMLNNQQMMINNQPQQMFENQQMINNQQMLINQQNLLMFQP
jgi:hypothetical protein